MLRGDYSIQIDFDSLVDDPDPIVRLLAFNVAGSYGSLIGVQKIGADKNFHCSFRTATIFDAQTNIARTNDYGKLRQRRVGSDVYNECQDGAGGWQLINSKTQNTDDLLVKLHAKTYATSTQSCNFDNFVINSGTIIGV